MLLENQTSFDKETVGCILTHKGKYFLAYRKKNTVWNSISGKIEPTDASPEDAICREIQEELYINIIPKKLTTTFHKYDSKIVKYHLFYHDLTSEELASIYLDPKEHSASSLFSLDEALTLSLYEDEDYCLKLHEKTIMKH